MSTKKLIVLGLVLLFALSLAVVGCAPEADEPEPDPDENGEPTEPADDEEPIKVALGMSGPATDGGWNTLAYEGLQSIADEYGFEVAYTENVAQDDQVSVLRDYARADFDIIIGHGFEWEDSIVTLAEEYPDIWFGQIGGEAGGTYPNVTSGVFRTGDAGYVAGTLMNLLTETGTVGFVGAMEIPTIAEEVMVAQAVSEQEFGHEFVVSYTGSWTDVSAGYEAASAVVEEGADVIIGIGNAADMGAIQIAEERAGEVIYIGWVGDLHDLAPDVIATSMREDVGWVMRDFVQQYLDGEEGTAGVYGLQEGAKYLGTWADWVDEDIKEEVLALQEEFIQGEKDRYWVFDELGLEPKVSYE